MTAGANGCRIHFAGVARDDFHRCADVSARNMLIFVDESGDTGFKFEKGSTDYFVVTAVLFEEPAHAESCAAAIHSVRRSLRLSSKSEFKFNKANHRFRMAFFEAIRQERFRYHSFALNKRKTVGQGFRHKDSAYKAPIRFLFENMRHDLPGATVWFDRCGDRGFADNLKNYLMKRLRDKTGKSPFRKIKSVTSHSNVLIQMADMVCGAVACSLKPERTDAADYRNAIKSHEVRLRVWP